MQARDLSGRYTVDSGPRIYTDENDVWLPSVSTVLDVRKTPEALENWKRRTDNVEAYMSYTQSRGTLAHEHCLSDLVPTDPLTGDPVIELWGKEERNAAWSLHRAGNSERARADCRWIADTWELVKRVANFDDVLDVETFVVNTDIGYGGQFDLLYQDNEAGETVLADLKTSKNVYTKHCLQLVAYRMAVPMSIDRMEVIRMNPEHADWEISSSHDWNQDLDALAAEFIDLRDRLEQQKLETIVETIKETDGDQPGIVYEPLPSEMTSLSELLAS